MENRHPPRGLLRLLNRFPILLYRLRLGWLLGGRFLLLTHIGRKSGRPRRVVLEMVRHDRKTDTCVIASGWGEQPDWLRNLRKTPEVVVQVGGRRWPALAVRLERPEVEQELFDYSRRHPVAFSALVTRFLAAGSPTDPEKTCQLLSNQIPMFVLQARKTR